MASNVPCFPGQSALCSSELTADFHFPPAASCPHSNRMFLQQSALQRHRNILCAWQVELISWKSIKDIAGDGGVIKTIETEGQGWEKPSDKDEALGNMHMPLVDCILQ